MPTISTYQKILLLSFSSQDALIEASSLCSDSSLAATLMREGFDLRILHLDDFESVDSDKITSFRNAMGTCRAPKKFSMRAIKESLGDWRPDALLPFPLLMHADAMLDSIAACVAFDFAVQTENGLPLLSLEDALVKRALACAMLSDLQEIEAAADDSFATSLSIAEHPIFLENFAVEPIAHLRVAFIGMGRRAGYLQALLIDFEGLDIVALCDIKENSAQEAADALVAHGRRRPTVYAQGELDYLRMLEEEKLDAVFVTVGWQWHADICCAAMEAGAHAFVEVPLAMSVEDLWRVVNCAERNQRHCMMLENACYGREELMFLNMVQQGVIGEPIHAEAGYIHDLRFALLDAQRGESSWRLPYYMRHNGNLYPTHGIGPISKYMGLVHGGDQFSHLVSMSSRSVGFSRFIKKNYPAQHEWNQQSFECGDVNTSLIRTKRGNTIMLQWDECSLRPYTRHNLIQGEKGILAQFPTRVIAECLGSKMHDDWMQSEEALLPIYEKYEHPLWRRFAARAEKLAGSRARDYLMLRQIVHGLHAGLPMDQSIYEGATWSAITELTERSVAAGGSPINFPDFTRGRA